MLILKTRSFSILLGGAQGVTENKPLRSGTLMSKNSIILLYYYSIGCNGVYCYYSVKLEILLSLYFIEPKQTDVNGYGFPYF